MLAKVAESKKATIVMLSIAAELVAFITVVIANAIVISSAQPDHATQFTQMTTQLFFALSGVLFGGSGVGVIAQSISERSENYRHPEERRSIYYESPPTVSESNQIEARRVAVSPATYTPPPT